MMFQMGETFEYLSCANCGCVQIVEIPKNLSDYYPKNYYSFQSSNTEPSLSSLKNFFRKVKYRYAVENKSLLGKFIYYLRPDERLYSLRYLPTFNKKTSFLDVGSGSGDLLKALHMLGYQSLVGIDPYTNKDEVVDDHLKILKRNLSDCSDLGKFDVVMFHHVFEHLSEPLEALKIAYSLLPDDGVCMIRIPTADSFAFKNYKEHWVQLDAPRHFFIHTRDSMKIIAKQANMQIINIIDDSNDFQFWGSEQYQKGITLFSKESLANRKIKRIINTFTKKLKSKAHKLNKAGEGDQTVFILTKIN